MALQAVNRDAMLDFILKLAVPPEHGGGFRVCEGLPAMYSRSRSPLTSSEVVCKGAVTGRSDHYWSRSTLGQVHALWASLPHATSLLPLS